MRICCLRAASASCAERGEDRSSEIVPDEQQTMMSLWSMLRSPLIFGGDLTSIHSLDPCLQSRGDCDRSTQLEYEDSLFKGRSACMDCQRSVSGSGLCRPVSIFSTSPAHVHMAWSQLGVAVSSATVHELWTGETLSVSPDVSISLVAHAVSLYKIERRR